MFCDKGNKDVRYTFVEMNKKFQKGISLKSAKTVFDNIDRDKYNVYRIEIDADGWFGFDENSKLLGYLITAVGGGISFYCFHLLCDWNESNCRCNHSFIGLNHFS